MPVSPLKQVNYLFRRTQKYDLDTASYNRYAPLFDAKFGMCLLAEAGTEKIVFEGKDLFSEPEYIRELIRFVKQDLGLESVCITASGNIITQDWIDEYAALVDCLNITCDSFSDQAKKSWYSPHSQRFDTLLQIKEWTQQHGIDFEISTLVKSYNWQNNMKREILELDPKYWNIFQ
jgi:radical S-adenosyl methionine domain-containing protein 2